MDSQSDSGGSYTDDDDMGSRSGSFSSRSDSARSPSPALVSGRRLLTGPGPSAAGTGAAGAGAGAGSRRAPSAEAATGAGAEAGRHRAQPSTGSAVAGTPVAKSGATVILKGKVVVVGDIAVGKTSIVSHITAKGFNKSEPSSIGVAFSQTTLHLGPERVQVKLDLWDTAGQERFRSINRLYYRGAAAGVVVYDVANRISFDTMKTLWMEQLRAQGCDDIIIAVAGNKCDLPASEREVSFEEGARFAAAHNCLFAETSAKTGDNVQALFELIAREAAERCRVSINSSGGAVLGGTRGAKPPKLSGAKRGVGEGSRHAVALAGAASGAAGDAASAGSGFQIVGVEQQGDSSKITLDKKDNGKRKGCCGAG